jgi:hypothetical protein
MFRLVYLLLFGNRKLMTYGYCQRFVEALDKPSTTKLPSTPGQSVIQNSNQALLAEVDRQVLARFKIVEKTLNRSFIDRFKLGMKRFPHESEPGARISLRNVVAGVPVSSSSSSRR